MPENWILLSATLRGSIRFPTSGFTSLWTLSSKFFSTFPHGTCLLSVLPSYLVLGGVYLLINIALSSNVTLSATDARKRHLHMDNATGLAPSMGKGPLSEGLAYPYKIIWTPAITQHRFPPLSEKPLRRTIPCSLAVTRGISFDFFSSAELYA